VLSTRNVNRTWTLLKESDELRRVLLVFSAYLYMFVWLILGITTRYIGLNNLLRPHLPGWALLVIGLTAPITLAVLGLHTTPWSITRFLLFIVPLQGALFGLLAEKYRYVQVAVTALVWVEAYFVLPAWNRRVEDRGKGSWCLGSWAGGCAWTSTGLLMEGFGQVFKPSYLESGNGLAGRWLARFLSWRPLLKTYRSV
jgi:hypothetical protein